MFPQAVLKQAGLLPNVYTVALAVRPEADTLLRLTLPRALPVVQARQRVKRIGPTGEVISRVVRAEGATLLVAGAAALRGQAEVFAFGLENADVRVVNYEALAMPNVSATQELARQVAALQQQNAALDRRAAATAAASTTSFEARLRALEARVGQARK